MDTFNEFVDTCNVNINFVECYGIISVLSNNWNQFIMGEAIKLDRIWSKIVVNVNAGNKSFKYCVIHYLFRESCKSLSIVTTKWENELETSVEVWHGIYSISLCIAIDT